MNNKLSAFSLLILLPLSSTAGEQGGVVTEIRVSSPGIANPTHVLLSSTTTDTQRKSRPTCATQDWWQINTDTTVGKNILATLLAAQASGKSVTIWGNGSCTLRTDMEDIVQVGVKN